MPSAGSKKITLKGWYKLPAPIAVTPACLGQTFKVEVGSDSGVAYLPTGAWDGDRPVMRSPTGPDGITRVFDRFGPRDGWDQVLHWGSIAGWHVAKREFHHCSIAAVGMEFKVPRASITYREYLHGLGSPDGTNAEAIFGGIDAWFDRLRAWLEVAVDQDINPSEPIAYSNAPGSGLTLVTESDGEMSLPASFNVINITVASFQAVTLPRLRRAANLTNRGETPSDVHLLLRESRAALRRMRLRLAVIDAGTAVELALAEYNRVHTQVNTPRLATLGWFVGQPRIAAAVGVPSTLKAELVDIRNSAIHDNRVPSIAEARRAVDQAELVVRRIAPLPL